MSRIIEMVKIVPIEKASVTKGADGFAFLSSDDSSCTLPVTVGRGAPFKGTQLPAYVSDAVKQAHTREGYMEVLNMADVLAGSDLYKNIKHVKGVPGDCTGTAVQNLLTETVLAGPADAAAAGLVAPSGQLTGWWAILNQEQLAVYSGIMTAVQAVDGAGEAPCPYRSPQFRQNLAAGVIEIGRASCRERV